MPTEHAAKIRIYTFLSDVAPEGQVKIACPFSIGTISKKYGGIVPNIVPIELQKPLFYAAVGKEKILSTHKTILALLTNRLS